MLGGSAANTIITDWGHCYVTIPDRFPQQQIRHD
jgi:hypothetical protein